MKIIFICGSLEPGRDGVGDYTRRLSAELIRQGHIPRIIAINDSFIQNFCITEAIFESTPIQVLRISANATKREKSELSTRWIEAFDPDWLSLQFVPFAFHSKGMPYNLGSFLSKVGGNRKWHIMFHELWVLNKFQESIKFWWLGNIQKSIVKRLVSDLKPFLIHTQSKLYQKYLLELGSDTKLLPLFSNIPVVNELSSNTHFNQDYKNKVGLILFGSIHPNNLISDMARESALLKQDEGVDISLSIIGKTGHELEYFSSIWKSFGLPINILGEQSAKCISEVLHNGNVGISTTPYALMDKSGTVAAMIEHGLPILCIAKPWLQRTPDDSLKKSGIFQYQKGNLKVYITEKKRNLNAGKAAEIAHRFAESLASI